MVGEGDLEKQYPLKPKLPGTLKFDAFLVF